MTNTGTKLHIMGRNDEQTVCDACGKVELRCTVILADADGIEAGRYGTTCAGRILGWRVTAADAATSERTRRQHVMEDIREAQAETDPKLIAWWIRQIVARGIHRADELAAVETLRAVAA